MNEGPTSEQSSSPSRLSVLRPGNIICPVSEMPSEADPLNSGDCQTLEDARCPLAADMHTVDPVDGVSIERDTGDAVSCILESINLPPLSLPIIRSGQALVDGGLLNNVPANVLVSRGCNFVIASTVSAKIERDFQGIRSKQMTGTSKYCSSIEVIMRANMIQSQNMNSVGVKLAGFVIAPDVTSFDLLEFTRSEEMAVIGESTTDTSIHKLKSMLPKLDSKLFA